jgi:hypothetical protein
VGFIVGFAGVDISTSTKTKRRNEFGLLCVEWKEDPRGCKLSGSTPIFLLSRFYSCGGFPSTANSSTKSSKSLAQYL